MLFLLQASQRVTTPPHTDKRETAHSYPFGAKLLFFSVLLAECQRNNHFSGCKGTNYL